MVAVFWVRNVPCLFYLQANDLVLYLLWFMVQLLYWTLAALCYIVF
jgi:hypothetical protein